eukprot:scaffold1747_cov251-Pinguiococcus_pyrenoidosus.AAC.18
MRLDAQKIKMLLLGAGESGKSTIFKQMKVLYGAPLTEEEQRHYTQVVHSNVVHAVKTLVTMADRYFPDDTKEHVDDFDAIKRLGEFEVITPKIAAIVMKVWAAECVQKTWDRRAEFQIVDSHKEYFNDIERIGAEGYMATQQDILLTRVRTSGIVVEKYDIEGTQFEMYDVGGQRNERKKWIHCFENVTAVIFVAALSEYDQVLYENNRTNRMVEAIELFEEICNNSYFMASSMILFLNKRDLFLDKVVEVPIDSVDHFNDYDGLPGDFDDGVAYFLNKCVSLTPLAKRSGARSAA